MQTLNFLAVRAIVDNLDFSQTADLVQLLVKKLDQMKLIEIKKALSQKLQTKELNKYLPLVEKIDSMSRTNGGVEIEFNDNPRYKIETTASEYGEDEHVYVFGDVKIGLRTKKGWRKIQWKEDSETFDYLIGFSEIFQGTFELNGDNPEWGESIREYLEIDGKELVLK